MWPKENYSNFDLRPNFGHVPDIISRKISLDPKWSDWPYKYKYVLCYAEKSNSTWKFKGYSSQKANFYGGTSVDACVDFCSYLGFMYAGLLNG